MHEVLIDLLYSLDS